MRILALLGLALVCAAAIARPASSKPVEWTPAVASVFDVDAEPALGCWPWKPGRLNRGELVIAHRGYRCGQLVRVCYRRCATARVRDRGPYVAGRDVDLDLDTAKAAGVPFGVYRIRIRTIDRAPRHRHARRQSYRQAGYPITTRDPRVIDRRAESLRRLFIPSSTSLGENNG